MEAYEIRLLTLADVEAFVAHHVVHDAESGTEGELPYGPYGRGEHLDAEEIRRRTRQRWATAPGIPGWRRAFGLWHQGRVVGQATLTGGGLPADQHRAGLGLGVERAHRRRGHGGALLDAALDWARNAAGIDWVDLGVFVGNDVAIAMYVRAGFRELGRTVDLFRVDGRRIDNVAMTKWVGTGDPPA